MATEGGTRQSGSILEMQTSHGRRLAGIISTLGGHSASRQTTSGGGCLGERSANQRTEHAHLLAVVLKAKGKVGRLIAKGDDVMIND
jgi:hypothetical protein